MRKHPIWPKRHRRIGEQVPRLASKRKKPSVPRTNLVPVSKSTKSVKLLRELVLMREANPEQILERLDAKYGKGNYGISTVNNVAERLGQMGFLYSMEMNGQRVLVPTMKAKLQMLKAERLLANKTPNPKNTQRLLLLRGDLESLRIKLNTDKSQRARLRIRNIEEWLEAIDEALNKKRQYSYQVKKKKNETKAETRKKESAQRRKRMIGKKDITPKRRKPQEPKQELSDTARVFRTLDIDVPQTVSKIAKTIHIKQETVQDILTHQERRGRVESVIVDFETRWRWTTAGFLKHQPTQTIRKKRKIFRFGGPVEGRHKK